MRWSAALLLFLSAILLLSACATAEPSESGEQTSAPTTSSPTAPDGCEAARRLIDSGQPRRALEFIAGLSAATSSPAPTSTTSLSPTAAPLSTVTPLPTTPSQAPGACAEEEAVARQAVRDAAVFAAVARADIKESRWDEAANSAQWALNEDADSEEARELLRRAQHRVADETWAERSLSVWHTTRANFVDPLVPVLPTVLGIVLALLVLARFMVLIRLPNWSRSPRWAPSAFLVGGAVLAAAAAFTSAQKADDRWPGVAVAAVVFLFGTLVAAWTLPFMVPQGNGRFRVLRHLTWVVFGLALLAAMTSTIAVQLRQELNFYIVLLDVTVLVVAVGAIAWALAPAHGGGLRMPPWVRVTLMLVGLILCTAAAVLLTIADTTAVFRAVAGAFSAAVGSVCVAIALATRLRLHVDVRTENGVTDEKATAHVVALLTELAGSPSAGIEVPRGADVDILKGTAITGEPTSFVGKLLSRAVQAVLGWTPWRVTVDPENDVLSVIITRNGHAVSSAVIDRFELGLEQAAPQVIAGYGAAGEPETAPTAALDLHRLVAAAVVVELAEHHTGFEGLCGATDWRSLGLHYFATVQLRHQPELKSSVLARAVEHDPGNLLSQIALRHETMRHVSEARRIRDYALWLEAVEDHLDGPGLRQLRRRIRHSRLAAWINYCYAVGGGTAPDKITHSSKPVGAALALLDCYEREGMLSHQSPTKWGTGDPLTYQARPHAASMLLWVADRCSGTSLDRHCDLLTKEWLTAPVGPTGDYQIACYEATRKPPQVARAVARLECAVAQPDLRDWMAQDPQLADLRSSPLYQDVFRQVRPRQDFLVLKPFAPFADRLRSMGVTNASDLARFTSNQGTLAASLKIDRGLAARMVTLGVLGTLVPQRLREYRVELCAALLELERADTRGEAHSTSPFDVLERHSLLPAGARFPMLAGIKVWLRAIRERTAGEALS